jgi:dTDP-4-amino-4,6-dideoxygalactose transaminase
MKIQRTIPPAAAPIYTKDLLHAVGGILSSKKYLRKLKNELKKYFGVKHVFLVSSGKAAFFLILQSLKSLSPERYEVLIPAYTCFSVPSAIVRAGLKVSLCDIEPSTFDFDYKLLEESINENTLCVIPDHLFGIPSDVDRIKSLCRGRDIFVVEDAAQAMGGMCKGKMIGTIGDVGFFSLGRGKNITSGSGGIIVTNSESIAQEIKKNFSTLESPSLTETFKEFLKSMALSFFIHPSLYWFPAGLPFLKLGETIFCMEFPVKMLSNMQAGLLKDWQRRLEESNQIRKENAKYFIKMLGLKTSNDAFIPYLRLPILVEEKELRDRMCFLSRERGLGISLIYPSAINKIEQIESQFNGRTFVGSSKIAEKLITMPTHNFLSEKDKKGIYELFQQCDPIRTIPMG